MSNQLVEVIFKDELTQEGLADLRAKYPADLVFNMADDEVFKAARKTRTEKNKLVEADSILGCTTLINAIEAINKNIGVNDAKS